MHLYFGKCTWVALCAVSLAGLLHAADSVFADKAFSGRWSTPFEPVKFEQLGDQEGAQLINTMGEGFAESNCPATVKREFYRVKGTRTSFLVYACTSGNILVGRWTNVSEGRKDPGDFQSDPIPVTASTTTAPPQFMITVRIATGESQQALFQYLDGGSPTPLAWVTDQVTLGTATPLSGASLLASEPLPAFKADVTFRLYTANQASVVVVLADKQGVVNESAPVTVAKSEGSRQSTFLIPSPTVTRPLQGPLTLSAEVRSPSGTVLATSNVATYNLYVPAGVQFSPDAWSMTYYYSAAGRYSLGHIAVSDPDHSITELSATKQQEGSGTEWLKIESASPTGGVRFVVNVSGSGFAADTVYWNAIRVKWNGGEKLIPISAKVITCDYCGYLFTNSDSLYFETMYPYGSNEVKTAIFGNGLYAPESITGVQFTQSKPSLVDVTSITIPRPAPVTPDKGFAAKLSANSVYTLGTRSTVLTISATHFQPVRLLVTANVLPFSTHVVPILSPTGLSFNGTFPATQISVNCAAYQEPVFVSTVTLDGSDWLQVADEANGITVCGKDHTGIVTVSVNEAALPPAQANGWGTVKGYIKFQIGDVIRSVRVSYTYFKPVVAPASASGAKGTTVRKADAGCAPTGVVVTETALPDSFSAPVGTPVALSAQLTDDCGTALTDSSVTATFSNGDRPIQMRGDGSGTFTATWQPLNPLFTTKVRLLGESGDLTPDTLEIQGEVTPEPNPLPSLDPGRILNSLNPVEGAPLSPGMLVQVNGHNLATGTDPSGVELQIGDISAPIISVSESQLIAQIPAELEPNHSYPVVLSVNGNYALPQELFLVAAQPGAAASLNLQPAVNPASNHFPNRTLVAPKRLSTGR